MTYDVIVVGARVAGTATATLLGQRGWRVLLLEQAAQPVAAVSTHFFGPTVLAHLDRLGVLDTVLATGAPKLARWHLEVEGASYGAPMVPRSDYPYNLCVRRDVLDGVLLARAAAEPTVELRTGRRVRGLIREGDRVVGVVGDGWEEKAHVVIGADGRNSPTARLVGADLTFDGGTLRCTAHAYWRDVVPLPEPALELWRQGDQVIQLGPCDRDWVIMISLPQAHVSQLRAEADEGYVRRLHDIPAMRARLRHARIASPVYRSGALRNFIRTPAGPGWRLVGDAVAHKDPLLGAGIADAVAGAQALADTVGDALGGRSEWVDAEAAYRASIDQRSGQRLPQALADLPIQPARDDQLAWIRGVLGHPAFAIELGQRLAQLLSALPPERRRYWQQVADDTADRLGLPAPERIVE